MFSFKLPINLRPDSNWMIGLTSLEVYNSIFKITEHKHQSELYTDFLDEFSFMEIKDELEEIFDIENITHRHLQNEKKDHLLLNSIKK